jgi:ABC-type uncharacterized transport system ATPase component
MIEITALQKTFTQPGGEQVPALRGIDLAIPTGQWVTVIGTNGSGKSTLLNALAGSFFPDGGSIRIDGIEVTKQPEYRRASLIGRVFQDPFKGTCPSMTVAENLRMAELRGSRRGLRIGLGRAATERYPSFWRSSGCVSRDASLPRWEPSRAASVRRSRCSWRRSSDRSFCCWTNTLRRSIRGRRRR